MKIFIACSTNFYHKIKDIKDTLINNGHTLIMPNGYDENITDYSNDGMTDDEYREYFKKLFLESKEKVKDTDVLLVLNYPKEKNGKILDNYIGVSTFMEMHEAFINNKKIYMMNGYPDNMLLDEIKLFNPIILNGDLSKIN